MKHQKFMYFLFVWCSLLVAFSPGYALKKVAQSKLQFLKFGMGARSVAMGEAYTAMSGDPNCIFYNPAGTAFVKGLELAFNHSQWIADIQYQSAVMAYNAGRFGTFTLSYVTVNYGTFERTIVDEHAWEGYSSEGNFNVDESAFGLGYARQITDRFFVGGQIKYAYQNLGSSRIWEYMGSQFESTREIQNETNVVAYDFGTYYNSGFKNLTVAMAVQNFANKPIPLTFRFGLAMDFNQLFFSDLPNHQLTLSCDVLHPRDFNETMQFGAEYRFKKVLALRGGYKMNYDEQGLSGGVGLLIPYKTTRLQFDYAFIDFGVFGMIQKFSLGLGF
jgi:hypothetical protein